MLITQTRLFCSILFNRVIMPRTRFFVLKSFHPSLLFFGVPNYFNILLNGKNHDMIGNNKNACFQTIISRLLLKVEL